MGVSPIPVYLDANSWQQQPENYRIGIPPLLHQPLTTEGHHVSGKPGSMSDRARQANIPHPEAGLKCPRCESSNTKFCYFNNYSLSQPRHFCKACRRYWTRGGALRNVPVGGGSRRNKKNKRSRSKSPALIVSRSYTTSDLIMNHQMPQPSQLPMMTSLQNHNDPSGFQMGINTLNTVDQPWRFPFFASSTFEPTSIATSYAFQSHQSADTLSALAFTSTNSTLATATRAVTQLSSPVDQYVRTRPLHLATSSTPSTFTTSTDPNEYWGGGNSWTDHMSALNSSSTTQLL